MAVAVDVLQGLGQQLHLQFEFQEALIRGGGH